MAIFVNISGGLTSAGARKVGSRSSFVAATYYMAGQAPVAISRQVPPMLAEDENGNPVDRPSVSLGSLLDHPQIAQTVAAWEKDAVLLKKASKAVDSNIRDNRLLDLSRREKTNFERAEKGLAPVDPEGGAPREWDHLTVSLDASETAWLADNPDKEAVFRQCVIDALRWHPNATGERQALVTEIHKDTGRWHVQLLVSRLAVDLSTNPPTVPPAVDMSHGGTLQKIVQKLNDSFRDNGLKVAIRSMKDDPESLFDGEKPARSITENRRLSDEAKEDYAELVKAEGGAPSADATVGPLPDLPLEQRIVSTVTPTADGILRAKELTDKEGLAAAQEAVRLRKLAEDFESKAKAHAERSAKLDEALAALAALEAEKLARTQAEQARAETESKLTATSAELDAVKSELTDQTEARDIAESLAQERFTRIEDLEAELSAEKDENKSMAGELETLRTGYDELAAKLAGVQDQARAFEAQARELAEREAQANAELAAVKESLPDRIANAVATAVAAAEARLQKTFELAVNAMQATIERLTGENAALRQQLATAPTATAPAASQEAAAGKPRLTEAQRREGWQNFLRSGLAFDELSAPQQRGVRMRFEKAKADGLVPAETELDLWLKAERARQAEADEKAKAEAKNEQPKKDNSPKLG